MKLIKQTLLIWKEHFLLVDYEHNLKKYYQNHDVRLPRYMQLVKFKSENQQKL